MKEHINKQVPPESELLVHNGLSLWASGFLRLLVNEDKIVVDVYKSDEYIQEGDGDLMNLPSHLMI